MFPYLGIYALYIPPEHRNHGTEPSKYTYINNDIRERPKFSLHPGGFLSLFAEYLYEQD